MSVIMERPHFSEEEAETLARTLYDLTVSAHALPSERDQNFLLKREGQAAFVLKLANGTEQREILDLQNQAMAHVGPGFCSQVQPTLAGEEIATVKGKEGASHFVRLLTYFPGRPLGNVRPHSPELLHSLGYFFGRLEQALAEFSHPAAHRELYWDLKHAGRVINQHVEHISSPERQALVRRFLAEFETGTAPLFPSLRTTVIHGDGNDYNILVGDSRPGTSFQPQEVSGVIDFGDMVY